MISTDLMEAAKRRLRKTTTNELDHDISQLAEFAIQDLRRIGVAESYLTDCTDPIIREAILTYVNAMYGANPDRAKLLEAYDMILTKIKGGRYGPN